MSSSDLSSLSSLPPTDDEAVEKSINRAVGLERYFKPHTAKEPSPDAPAPREKSPPHEYVLADNEIIAVSPYDFLSLCPGLWRFGGWR